MLVAERLFVPSQLTFEKTPAPKCKSHICPKSNVRLTLKGMFMILNILLESKLNISFRTYLIFIDHSFIC